MIEPIPTDSTAESSPPFLPLLLILFFGSGCSALIYEIVWFQLLQFVIGSTAYSLGVLLGTFMGGMCIGSLLMPRLISTKRHPLRVYALLEVLIGVIAIIVLFGMPTILTFYVQHVGGEEQSRWMRALVCAACLLPPTILMGATLPAIARYVELTPKGVSWLGFFYGGNIAGAVFGSLLAGFELLRKYDMPRATFVAAGINGGVALFAFLLSRIATQRAERIGILPIKPIRVPGAWTIYIGIALSGMTALGAEVVWTRLLSLALGGTVYTFSIILAVFLLGLGIGSTFGAILSRTLERPALALGWCQVLLTGAIAWAAYMVAASLPYWPVNTLLPTDVWTVFQFDLSRCCWAILPATILWGAAFPLALAAVAPRGSDSGKIVGGIYAANTVGAIAGALLCSLVLIPNRHPFLQDTDYFHHGTQMGERFLIIGAMVSGLLILIPAMARFLRRPILSIVPVTIVGCAAAWVLVFYVPRTPPGLIAYGRQLPINYELYLGNRIETLYMGEGMNSSIAVTQMDDGTRNFHVSGKVEASNMPQDMRMERMLGHIAALVHPAPETALVVGCGAGVTAGSFITYPSIQKITICELEPLIPKVVAGYFAKENYGVVENPRCQVIYDDARHYVLTAKEKYDIITSDPIHPWVKGSANLYTKEYYQMVKDHLKPGGIVTQWVPLYESNAETVKSEIATFAAVFPNASVWANDYTGGGYDVIVVGSNSDLKIDIGAMQKRLDREDHFLVTGSISQVGWHNAVELLSCYAGQVADMKPWLDAEPKAEITTDWNLRLMYTAGMGLNLDKAGEIYQDILKCRKFHDEVFTGSDDEKANLKKAMGMQ